MNELLGMATSRLRALGSECPQAEDLASASAQWLRHTAPSHKRTNRSTCVLCATTLATTRSTTNGYFHSEEDAQSHRELGYRAGTNGADVIGLNLDPPAHAAVFCVDEETRFKHSIARTGVACRTGFISGHSGTRVPRSAGMAWHWMYWAPIGSKG